MNSIQQDPTRTPQDARLASSLERTAQRVVEHGTVTEAAILCAMAAATRTLAPGAAAALVDWSGSEIARLRAFGIVQGVVERSLHPRDRARLLEQVARTGPHENHGLTAVMAAGSTAPAVTCPETDDSYTDHSDTDDRDRVDELAEVAG